MEYHDVLVSSFNYFLWTSLLLFWICLFVLFCYLFRYYSEYKDRNTYIISHDLIGLIPVSAAIWGDRSSDWAIRSSPEKLRIVLIFQHCRSQVPPVRSLEASFYRTQGSDLKICLFQVHSDYVSYSLSSVLFMNNKLT